MRIGFLTACLPGSALPDLASWAAAQGFEMLEVAAWPVTSERDYQARQLDVEHLSAERAAEIKELLAQYGLGISSLAYYDNTLEPNPARRAQNHTHLRKVIDAAALLGVDLVGTFVGGRPDLDAEGIIKEAGQVLREIVAYAEDRGVRLMVENCPMENWQRFGLPGNFAYSPELWEALFNEVPSDKFGLNLDPSHLHWLGIDYCRCAREFARRIFHVHAKDCEILAEGRYRYGILGRQIRPEPWKSGWWRYRIPGLGEIDWRRFISVLQEAGYDFVLSIEHEDPVWEGTEEKVKKGLGYGLRYLRQFIV